jgi:chemotaxis protein CheX
VSINQEQTTIGAQFASAFRTGAVFTLDVQCKVEVKPEKAFGLEANQPIPADICGVIGLTSPKLMGSVTLCFPTPVFLHVMGSMFGETFSEVNDELAEGAGELMNIIFGKAKTILNESGLSLEKALPTVVHGKDIKVTSFTKGEPTIVMPFSTKCGTFHLLITLMTQKEVRKAA